ncbi:MAG: dipeptidase [Ferruginibacter sp.]
MLKLIVFLLWIAACFSAFAQKEQEDKFIFIDTHNDVMSKQILSGADLAISQPALNFDLVKASKGNLGAQVFSIWCDEVYGKGKAFNRANREMDSLLALIKRNPGKMTLVTNAKDLKKALKQQKFAAMIGVEGGHMIEERMDLLDSLISRGMKYLTLTWNNSTGWATSARDEETKKDSLPHLGLTVMGKQIVKRLNDAGVMVDVSHAGEKTFDDVIAVSAKPVIASHSCAWSLTPHRRNLKDNQLKAIAKNGGVVFVNFYSGFLDSSYENKKLAFLRQHKSELDSLTSISGDIEIATISLFSLYQTEAESFRPPLSNLIRNIDYIAKMIGVDHVGFGADYDGAESFPSQMNDVSCYPLVAKELKKLGYSKRDIKKIAGGNFIRVLKANERKL